MEFQNDENSQNILHIERKRQLSDILQELIEKGFGASKGMINKNDLKLKKNFKSEYDIFKLTFE